MADYSPKVSPVTGKFMQFGIITVLGHLSLKNWYFVCLEEGGHDAISIRNYEGIHGWITERKEVFVEAIKETCLALF